MYNHPVFFLLIFSFIRWLIISLLFISPGASSLTVEGRKGGNITLPCSLTNREDLTTVLTFGPIKAYGAHQDKWYKDRVHKTGSCNLILQDLKTTDAGKYVSQVFANGQLLNIYTYDVHLKVTLTGQKGEELMFELPREAESVEQITDTNSKEVWRRGEGVPTDWLSTESFSSSDTGTYRVLNSTGGILVTVTVTESSTGLMDRMDHTHEDEPHDRERVHVCVGIGFGVLVALIVFVVIMNHRCRNRNEERNSYQEVQLKETVQGPRSPNNSSGCLVCLQCQQICRGSCQHIIPDSVS
ncbi:uncharacterized protein LOC131525796 isoform X1 [Onychostoma macrolepis]|nr:uncharacterized protein LOC131525796 isoform X1 [Onychostoma macrolepis]